MGLLIFHAAGRCSLVKNLTSGHLWLTAAAGPVAGIWPCPDPCKGVAARAPPDPPVRPDPLNQVNAENGSGHLPLVNPPIWSATCPWTDQRWLPSQYDTLTRCRFNVCDAGPIFNQHWVSVSCWLRYNRRFWLRQCRRRLPSIDPTYSCHPNIDQELTICKSNGSNRLLEKKTGPTAYSLLARGHTQRSSHHCFTIVTMFSKLEPNIELVTHLGL